MRFNAFSIHVNRSDDCKKYKKLEWFEFSMVLFFGVSKRQVNRLMRDFLVSRKSHEIIISSSLNVSEISANNSKFIEQHTKMRKHKTFENSLTSVAQSSINSIQSRKRSVHGTRECLYVYLFSFIIRREVKLSEKSKKILSIFVGMKKFVKLFFNDFISCDLVSYSVSLPTSNLHSLSFIFQKNKKLHIFIWNNTLD